MKQSISKIWNQLWLEERSSLSMSLFRIVVALTTMSVLVPSLIHLEELYYKGSFRTLNGNFFPVWFLDIIQKSPDSIVLAAAILFYVSAIFLLAGFLSQVSCIIMTMCCYYFYALNSFHVGTLSWDILLVTLVLMCVSRYHGDYFSVDALFSKSEQPWNKKRPFFVQRLLQMQLAFTFFYTALAKSTAQGNWITDNPLYYVLNYPSQGVTKDFMLRDFIRSMPHLIYYSGILILVIEFFMIFLLFNRKTRLAAIYLGIAFQTLLVITLDVPATFFFLFPSMFLLFINSDEILSWVEVKRRYNESAKRPILIYDGNCGFCLRCLKILKKMDLFSVLEYKDYQGYTTSHTALPGELTESDVSKQIYLVTIDGKTFGGFFAFKRISWQMPMMWPVIPILFFPGMRLLGPMIYRWVARNRKLFSCRLVK